MALATHSGGHRILFLTPELLRNKNESDPSLSHPEQAEKRRGKTRDREQSHLVPVLPTSIVPSNHLWSSSARTLVDTSNTNCFSSLLSTTWTLGQDQGVLFVLPTAYRTAVRRIAYRAQPRPRPVSVYHGLHFHIEGLATFGLRNEHQAASMGPRSTISSDSATRSRGRLGFDLQAAHCYSIETFRRGKTIEDQSWYRRRPTVCTYSCACDSYGHLHEYMSTVHYEAERGIVVVVARPSSWLEFIKTMQSGLPNDNNLDRSIYY